MQKKHGRSSLITVVLVEAADLMYQLVQTQRDLLVLINNPQPHHHQLHLILLQHEAETEAMIKNYLEILNFKVNLKQSKTHNNRRND